MLKPADQNIRNIKESPAQHEAFKTRHRLLPVAGQRRDSRADRIRTPHAMSGESGVPDPFRRNVV
ncbi:MAG TPA: hypothetical protein VFR86_14910 [Burkholderiaceae bacterium]|nr:hypothetical protein [Burkholderiaceae bacterium]